MELDQLIPERATIIKKIEGDGETRELEINLRPFSLEDESWLKVAFGDKLKELFETMNMEAISRICFHQMEIEAQRELMKIKFMEMDEDGEEKESSKTGPQKIRKLIVGYPEQMELLTALLKTRGFSMPVIEELSKHMETEAKEEITGKQKKARKKKFTGAKSSI